MNLHSAKNSVRGGYALLIVLFFTGVSVLLLSAALQWTSNQARQVERSNYYLGNGSAAEAAVEKVLGTIGRDFQSNGETYVYSNLTTYQGLVPTAAESSVWTNYEFSDAQGNLNKSYVTRLSNWSYGDLQTKYSGTKGYSATYRVVSDARTLATNYSTVTSGLKQDVQLAAIPIFGFGVFYGVDLEISPGSDLALGGRVHCNGSMYLQPQGNLNFASHATATQKILLSKSPNDPTSRTFGKVNYSGLHDDGVKSLNLPFATNNTSTLLHKIIEMPPAGEAITSLTGQQRYYNNCDMMILVSNATVVSTSGSYNNFSVSIPWSKINNFLNTNKTFYNMREAKTVQCTDFDVNQFNGQYAYLTGVLGRSPKCIYIADLRTQSGTTEPGVRLSNGQTLSTNGMTIATLNPLYVQGHFNAPSAALGTTNTANTAPAALIADAITFLSGSWSDNQGGANLNARTAANTTFNTAIIAGIVQSGNGYYSGGVENFMRLLEDWSSKTLTFNGSMVGLYASQQATAPWGASATVYNTPIRRFGFDSNFLTSTKLPYLTPQVRSVIRGQWAVIAPNSTQ